MHARNDPAGGVDHVPFGRQRRRGDVSQEHLRLQVACPEHHVRATQPAVAIRACSSSSNGCHWPHGNSQRTSAAGPGREPCYQRMRGRNEGPGYVSSAAGSLAALSTLFPPPLSTPPPPPPTHTHALYFALTWSCGPQVGQPKISVELENTCVMTLANLSEGTAGQDVIREEGGMEYFCRVLGSGPDAESVMDSVMAIGHMTRGNPENQDSVRESGGFESLGSLLEEVCGKEEYQELEESALIAVLNLVKDHPVNQASAYTLAAAPPRAGSSTSSKKLGNTVLDHLISLITYLPCQRLCHVSGIGP